MIRAQIRQNFKKSGQQAAENVYDEWLKFADNYTDVCVYAIAIMQEGTMDQLGKALPDDLQRDTGARQAAAPPSARTYSDTIGAVNRRRQRQRRAIMEQNTPDSTTTRPSPINVTSVLNNALQSQSRLTALQFLASNGDARALAALNEIAFGVSDIAYTTVGTVTPQTPVTPTQHTFDDIEFQNEAEV